LREQQFHGPLTILRAERLQVAIAAFIHLAASLCRFVRLRRTAF
jgi:hypothetical protein